MKALVLGDFCTKKLWLVWPILDFEHEMHHITHIIADISKPVGRNACGWAMFRKLEIISCWDKWEDAGMVIVFHPNIKKSPDILQACQTAWECGVPVNLYRGSGLPTVYWRNPRSPNQRNPFAPCVSPTTA